MTMDEANDAIREMKQLGAEGYIRFSIKADDTTANQHVHDAFREFCKVECSNDYTLGLKTLLEYYQADAKFSSLYDHIQEIRAELAEVKDKISTKETKKHEDFTSF